ncbi:MAG: VWA domain-containing protein [Pseudomonadota bacterium]
MRVIKLTSVAVLALAIAGCATQQSGGLPEIAEAPAPAPVPSPPPPPPPPAPAPPPPPASVPVVPADEYELNGAVNRENVINQLPAAEASSQTVTVTGSRKAGDRVARIASPQVVGGTFVPPVVVPTDPGREQYDGEEVSPVKLTSTEPVSTFSVDVDTGSYSNTRRFLTQGRMPPKAAVRTEEMINYFRYDYDKPADRAQPFTVSTDVAKTPWNDDTYLMRIGLRGYDIARDERPAANLVFLMDVSGSMGRPDKLPLVKTALSGLASQLTEKDRVSIVVYAGAAGLVLEPTNDEKKIRRALDSLSAGGSTAGGAGIQLAYNIAEDNFIKDGVNRVILATDGDFNVGISNRDALIELIETKRDTGITLTTLGFGQGNYNEALMEQVANKGNGNYAYIDSALEAKKVLGEEMSSTLFTIAKDVKIQVEFNPAVIGQYRLVGYENRALREEDFDNDKVDAGEIGAGHQVTAIYEVVPAGKKGWIAPRRYETEPQAAAVRQMGEAAHVKLRYKLPDSDTSKLIDYVVSSGELLRAKAPKGDFAFATAVAAFGQILRGDEKMKDFTLEDVGTLAGNQDNFYRQEFLRLNELAASMKGG